MREWFGRHTGAIATAVVVSAFACLVPDLVLENHGQDAFIYRAGAALALAGNSPYDAAGLKESVAGQFVEEEHASFRDNHGFFLSPVGVVAFAPLAVLPWPVAKWAFAVASYAVAGLGCWHLFDFASPAARDRYGGVGRVGLVAAVMLDPVVFSGGVLQTGALTLGLVVLGEALRRRGRAWLGALCWAAVFAKPHVALFLLPLAWYAGGPRHLVRVCAATAALMGVGVAISGGPRVAADYVGQLQAGHKRVEFNKVTWNPQLTSWNRALYAAGGPAVELDAARTLAGYAVCGVLVAARVWRSGRPPAGWAFAAGAMAAIESCQVHAYEVVVAAVVLPVLLDWAAAGPAGRLPAAWLGAGMVLKSVPFAAVGWLHSQHAEYGVPVWLANVVVSVRSFGVLVVASGLVVWGYPRGAGMTNAPPMPHQ